MKAIDLFDQEQSSQSATPVGVQSGRMRKMNFNERARQLVSDIARTNDLPSRISIATGALRASAKEARLNFIEELKNKILKGPELAKLPYETRTQLVALVEGMLVEIVLAQED